MPKTSNATVNPNLTLDRSEFKRVTPEIAAPHNHFAGERVTKEVYNAAGCRIYPEVIVVRTYSADPYKLAVKLGDMWYELASIPIGDPVLEELPIEDLGPSPAEIETQRQKEEKERQRIEADQAQKEERRQAIIEQKERARALRRPDLAN